MGVRPGEREHVLEVYWEAASGIVTKQVRVAELGWGAMLDLPQGSEDHGADQVERDATAMLAARAMRADLFLTDDSFDHPR